MSLIIANLLPAFVTLTSHLKDVQILLSYMQKNGNVNVGTILKNCCFVHKYFLQGYGYLKVRLQMNYTQHILFVLSF